MKAFKFIISGGGTGGHIYPALAIADGLKARYPEAEFLFVGAQDRMEMQKVPQAGYKIKGLWISGIKRELSLDNLLFPFKLLSSLRASAKIIKEFKPDVVIGTGGFASGPLLKAAENKNIPCLLQEQNSYAGITNKLLSKKARTICVAYDDMDQFFPAEKIAKTGNPVRQDLLALTNDKTQANASFNLKSDKKTLLILGGSLGAREINAFIAQRLEFFENLGIQLIWQTGKLYYEQYKHHNALAHVHVTAFIDSMKLAYTAADVIISRAGAGSVSELCVVGKPVIFIPSPNVAEDHQTKNARAVADRDAAIVIPENELKFKFDLLFEDLINDPKEQARLSRHIKGMALPQATESIIEEIEKLILNKTLSGIHQMKPK